MEGGSSAVAGSAEKKEGELDRKDAFGDSSDVENGPAALEPTAPFGPSSPPADSTLMMPSSSMDDDDDQVCHSEISVKDAKNCATCCAKTMPLERDKEDVVPPSTDSPGSDSSSATASSVRSLGVADEDQDPLTFDDQHERPNHVVTPDLPHPGAHHVSVEAPRSDMPNRTTEPSRDINSGIIAATEVVIEGHLVENSNGRGAGERAMSSSVLDARRSSSQPLAWVVSSEATEPTVFVDDDEHGRDVKKSSLVSTIEKSCPCILRCKACWRSVPRNKRLVIQIVSAFSIFLLGLVVGLLVRGPSSRIRGDGASTSSPWGNDQNKTDMEGLAFGNSSVGESGQNLTSSGPSSPNMSDGDRGNTNNGTASQQPEVSVEQWALVGDPIYGLNNETGFTISFDHNSGMPLFGKGPVSNFTWSGLSVALSRNGSIVAIGEPGTSTVRVFKQETRDVGSTHWVQVGRTLKVTEHCPGNEVVDHGADIANGGGNQRRLRRQMRPSLRGRHLDDGNDDDWVNWFLPCVTGFGFEVDVSSNGTTLAVGGVSRNHERGMLRVYDWVDQAGEKLGSFSGAGGDWVQRGSDVVGLSPGDGLGATVSISSGAETVAVSAPQSIHPAFANSVGKAPFVGRGYVRVYDWDPEVTEWKQRGDDIRGHSSEDGMEAVSITANGQTLAVGTFFGGYVDVLVWDGDNSSWVPRGGSQGNDALVAPLGEHDFGSPLSLSSADGSVLAISSDYIGKGDTTDAHLVYVFEWTGEMWKRRHRMAGLIRGAGEGFSVALSSDGSILAAAFSNVIQVFEWDGEHYVKVGMLEGGSFVGLSEDGKTLAVGRPDDHTNGLFIGSTSIYRRLPERE
uniref:Uncharacterized protein n=1 Tax=Pseudictyota dubia TaxID=2749911 RepID=A0A7R9W2A5_9STRA